MFKIHAHASQLASSFQVSLQNFNNISHLLLPGVCLTNSNVLYRSNLTAFDEE